MPFAIKLTDVADQQVSFVRLQNPWCGMWLQAYDPDAHDGFGDALFGPEVELALWFDSFDAAKACWGQQSTVRPLLDGAPNRPLTIVSISVEEVGASV